MAIQTRCIANTITFSLSSSTILQCSTYPFHQDLPNSHIYTHTTIRIGVLCCSMHEPFRFTMVHNLRSPKCACAYTHRHMKKTKQNKIARALHAFNAFHIQIRMSVFRWSNIIIRHECQMNTRRAFSHYMLYSVHAMSK